MDQTNPKPFVFVLMPFRPEFDDIYQVGIKAACLSAGAYCERVDEQIFLENILDRVYNQIAKADIIISVMTGRNPNVFYETGYAHALNKRAILLTQIADNIPFDLKHYPHIVYGESIALLKSELEKRIRWCIDNPTEPLTTVDLNLEFLINGIALHEGCEVQIPYTTELVEVNPPTELIEPGMLPYPHLTETGELYFSIQIGIHNLSSKVAETSRYHLALIVPATFIPKGGDVESATLQERRVIIRLVQHRSLFPDDWTSSETKFSIWRHDLPLSSFDLLLRLFLELGPKDIPFKVKFVQGPRVWSGQ